MRILSLFDGMSGAQIALNKIGIKNYTYYASEIDKYAIKVTMANYPDTIQLGDITQIKGSDLPKIDLLIGGSPCQGFSFAGKQLNFDDPRSKLFFEFVRLLKEIKPKKFILENVKMKKEYQDYISKLIGLEPILINSAIVSAQNRKRLYWTNIQGVQQPEDKGILLKDIIESGDLPVIKSHGKYKLKEEKAQCLDANYFKGPDNHGQRTIIVHNIYEKKGQNGNIYSINGKSKSLSAGTGIKGRGIGSSNSPKIAINRIEERDTKYKSNAHVNIDSKKFNTLRAQAGSRTRGIGLDLDGIHWRKLTPLECERLQTVPDNYTNHVSNTQRYKMLGNGFTVDVIAHILKQALDTIS